MILQEKNAQSKYINTIIQVEHNINGVDDRIQQEGQVINNKFENLKYNKMSKIRLVNIRR